MAKLIEFIRAGSDSDFLNPIVGSAWTKHGTPTYGARDKWGNGEIPSMTNNWDKYVAIGLQKFAFTYSCKLTSDSSVDTGFLYDVIGGYSANSSIGLTMNVNIGNVIAYPKGCVPYLFTLNSWSAGATLDFVINFDATAAAGTKIKVFQNGVDLGAPTSFTEYSGGDWSAAGVGVNIRLGYYTKTNIVIGTFKVWDNILTTAEILQALWNERAGLADRVFCG
jgi:hypothetical protein